MKSSLEVKTKDLSRGIDIRISLAFNYLFFSISGFTTGFSGALDSIFFGSSFELNTSGAAWG